MGWYLVTDYGELRKICCRSIVSFCGSCASVIGCETTSLNETGTAVMVPSFVIVPVFRYLAGLWERRIQRWCPSVAKEGEMKNFQGTSSIRILHTIQIIYTRSLSSVREIQYEAYLKAR